MAWYGGWVHPVTSGKSVKGEPGGSSVQLQRDYPLCNGDNGL